MSRSKFRYLIVIIGLILVVAGITVSVYRTYSHNVVRPGQPSTPQSTPTPTPDPLRPFSILLLGYGGGKHEGGLLTDSMIVALIKPRQSEITLISLPRDLWVSLPIGGTKTEYSKINAAYAIGSDNRHYPDKAIEFTGQAGGGQLAKYAASQVVGFPIDFFAAIDFQGFVKFIDLIGGIQVSVPKTFDDPLYPIESETIDNCGKTPEEIAALTATLSGTKLEEKFPCRYEILHFDKGSQLMDGTTALKYARSRHSPTDGGDFNRAARQRVILDAIKTRVINIGFIPKIISAVKILASHFQTDITLSELEGFVSQASWYSQYKLNSISLTDQNVLTQSKTNNGQFILIPTGGLDEFTAIHHFILSPTPTINLSPNPSVKN